jgi:hypothetical protein
MQTVYYIFGAVAAYTNVGSLTVQTPTYFLAEAY